MVDIRLEIDEGIDRQDLTRLRKRFLAVNHDRLQRAHLVMSSRQQLVLRLLPLLLPSMETDLCCWIISLWTRDAGAGASVPGR